MSYTFGYEDRPDWGIFSPPQSVFARENTLYGSLFTPQRRPTLKGYGEDIKAKRMALVYLLGLGVVAYLAYTRLPNIGRTQII